MDLDSLPWLAILVATVAAFGLGALWYGPLFGRPWQRLSGMSEERMAGANMPVIYGLAFVLQFVAVSVLALLLGPDATLAGGALTGLGVGAAWVATALGVTYLFSQASPALAAIDAGYHVAYYALAGAILGVL